MRKFFAFMAAMILAMTGMFAAASAEEAKQPFGMTMSMTTDADAMMAMSAGTTGAMQKEQLEAVASILNNLTITLQSDGVDTEIFLNLKGEEIAGFAVLQDDDCIRIASDAVPNYILKIEKKEMNFAGAGDPEQVAKLFAAAAVPFAKLGEQLQAKVGEPEAVEETYRGATFTTKLPINMTTKEMALMGMETLKEILSLEEVSSFMGQLKASGVPFDPAELLKQIENGIENLQNADDSTMPELDAAVFTNEAGDNMIRILMTQNNETVAIRVATIGKEKVVDVSAADKMDMLLTIAEDGAFDMDMNLEAQPGVKLTYKYTGNKDGGKYEVSVNGMKMMEFRVDIIPNAALRGTIPMEGKEEITLADLQNTSSGKGEEFVKSLQVSLVTLLGKIAGIMPEEATKLMPSNQ